MAGKYALNGCWASTDDQFKSYNVIAIREKFEREEKEAQERLNLLRRQTEAMEQANRSNNYNSIKYVNDFLADIEKEERLKKADKEFRRKLAIKQVEEKLGISEDDIRKWFNYYSGAATIDLTNRIVDIRLSINTLERKLDTAIFFRKRLQNRLNELKAEHDQKLKECLELGEERFNIINTFRKNHYCKEAEDLIEKLELHFSKLDEVIKEGTIEDYTNFIKEDLKRRR